MANVYTSGGKSRGTAIIVTIAALDFGFYLALVSGLAQSGVELLADVGIVDLPPPAPPDAFRWWAVCPGRWRGCGRQHPCPGARHRRRAGR